MIDIELDNSIYKNIKPYNHYYWDDVLNKTFAQDIKNEILNIEQDKFDRYANPFEQKWTLRDKNNLPENCQKLYNYLESDEFIEKLSNIVGIQLYRDNVKNFWGIHKYDNSDKLDIHVDAGIHPQTKMKKEVTLGIYLSKNWEEKNGGHLEIWKGENSSNNDAKLIECVNKVLPKFNRLVIFTCDDYSWHGNPHPVNCDETSKRIFFTLSYLSKRDENEYKNKRQKAFFVKLPNELDDPEKDKLRLLRADPEKYKEIYRVIM